ncbi:MAG TPA: proline--tRNA ligase [Longimicrobium sp.]|nr:proline--tRNA ligase [Longimicrobium sp.]
MAQQQTKAAPRTAIQPTRDEDYAQWYQAVVRDADVAEMSHVRGCMVIKPWGYGIWEQLQRTLDREIKKAGAVNAYFPLFIPLSYLEREAAHVEGFAKEMAVVTHHRLEARDGKLVPTGELAEPLIVRPTSETIIGESMSSWVQSYRDLPLLLNQWANVVRWELRPRVLLRTTEFLWQEGHTAHAGHDDAMAYTLRILHEVYTRVVEDDLAVPVIPGEKTEGERFPGAENTYCIEAMMQDGRALQAGTSHYLGQNFSKAFDISFQSQEGGQEHAYTTSWGVSTRLIGALVMTHADDNGLRVPPRVAPHQVVVVPMLRKDGGDDVMQYARRVADEIRARTFAGGRPIEVLVDDTLYEARDKKWKWVKRGVPLLLELGPKDMANDGVSFLRRDQGLDYVRMSREELVGGIGALLDSIQDGYLQQARAFQEARTRRDVATFDDFKAYFAENEAAAASEQPGFVIAKFCGKAECEEKARELGVTIRCMPFDQSGAEGRCVIDGSPATIDAVFARAY